MKKTINIRTDKIIGTPNPNMWGIFYEEINHAGDGGIYAELIRNRNFSESDLPEGTVYSEGKVRTKTGHTESFSIADPLPGWSIKKYGDAFAAIEKKTDAPRNPDCAAQMKLTVFGKARIINGGYWGIYAAKGGYNGFVITKSTNIQKITVGLMRRDGSVLTSAEICGITDKYGKFGFAFDVTEEYDDARFFIEADGNGSVYFDFVSLFPNDTYGNTPFRRDLFEMLQGMKPGFLRFPGGCVVEGINLENAIHWKNTIGAIEDRPGHWDLWNYRCTDGLGMLEFCLLGEALGADLMYVMNAGLSCQARRAEFADGEELDTWVQDALDAIEYIKGDADTKWGTKRAEDGHPEPFNLRYVEIGNENWGPEYFSRYALFRAAIREKYPELEIIADCLIPEEDYDLRDDHYYTVPQTFPHMNGRYKNEKEKIYVGEYACNTEVGYGNLLSAISEATFMTDMENCCDTVRIASYAPLFCNDNDRRWGVDLINFDRKYVFGLPSYFVQKLFACNKVESVVENDCEFIKGAETNLFVTAGIDGNDLVIKAANFGTEEIEAEFLSESIAAGKAEVDTVSGENPTDTNSLLYPRNIVDIKTEAAAEKGRLELRFAPWSFAVIRVTMV